MNEYHILLSSRWPGPDERGQAEHHSANEMKHHTISCFNYLGYQCLGKQVPEKEVFLSFPEGAAII